MKPYIRVDRQANKYMRQINQWFNERYGIRLSKGQIITYVLYKLPENEDILCKLIAKYAQWNAVEYQRIRVDAETQELFSQLYVKYKFRVRHDSILMMLLIVWRALTLPLSLGEGNTNKTILPASTGRFRTPLEIGVYLRHRPLNLTYSRKDRDMLGITD